MIFNYDIVRCELYPDEVSANFKFINKASGQTPALYKGSQVEFQFAIVKTRATETEDMELYDLSTFSGLPKMRIRTTTAAGAVLLDDTVSGAVIVVDPSLTPDTWEDGSKQHFRFYFPETATSITTGTQFIVIYGPDGDVFGISTCEVIDPGTGASASPAPGDPTYYSKTETINKLTDYELKVRAVDQPTIFFAKNPDTGKTVKITLQPVFDANGPRLVPVEEYID